MTILVIDENIMVRSVLETLLEREGFSVLSTRSVGGRPSDDDGRDGRSRAHRAADTLAS